MEEEEEVRALIPNYQLSVYTTQVNIAFRVF